MKLSFIIPAYNESAWIERCLQQIAVAVGACRARQVGDFDVEYVVADNNSTDDTADIAKAAGARVRNEPREGKGNVVRRMFADIEADIYLLVDADATYDAASAPGIIELLRQQGHEYWQRGLG